MNSKGVTGLGEPELLGRKSLFQPPVQSPQPKPIASESAEKPARKVISAPKTKETEIPEERIRMALDVTRKSLSIMQECQGRYRLETGYMLPKWKIISEALELYAKSKAGEGE